VCRILNPVQVQKPREIALRVLRRRTSGGEFIERLLEAELDPTPLSAPDRGLCRELVFGCVRWERALDWLIARRTDGRPQKPSLQILLRLGLYQLFWLDRVPDHAAVNETVELARQVGFAPQSGFVNAILRGCLREREALARELEVLKERQPALGWSHPDWLWDRWQVRWGAQSAIRLLEWNNTPPPTFARVNTLKTDASRLLERWRMAEGVEYDLFSRDWCGENLVFELKSHPPLARLGSFRDGWFYVQDPSTLMAVRLLDPQPGQAVLDLCAAPGGKTTFIAQLQGNDGGILACDTGLDRLRLLTDNCRRLDAQRVTPQLIGDTWPLALGVRQFERVLVDAPCSNSGVLRRRVDLRWRLRLEEIQRLRRDQFRLLELAAPRVAPGGVLVYSTCSLEPEENAEVVQAFLARYRHFHLETARELLPFNERVDGAYAARLVAAR
jgi:16S rRNA (cytosine967-C5)-methyltransferase